MKLQAIDDLSSQISNKLPHVCLLFKALLLPGWWYRDIATELDLHHSFHPQALVEWRLFFWMTRHNLKVRKAISHDHHQSLIEVEKLIFLQLLPAELSCWNSHYWALFVKNGSYWPPLIAQSGDDDFLCPANCAIGAPQASGTRLSTWLFTSFSWPFPPFLEDNWRVSLYYTHSKGGNTCKMRAPEIVSSSTICPDLYANKPPNFQTWHF